VFDLARCLDVLWLGIWKLNPVVKWVVSDPEHQLVDTLTSSFNQRVIWLLLSVEQLTERNPVVFLGTKNLTSETDAFCATHDRKTLFKVLKTPSLTLIDFASLYESCGPNEIPAHCSISKSSSKFWLINGAWSRLSPILAPLVEPTFHSISIPNLLHSKDFCSFQSIVRLPLPLLVDGPH
jgi:hypothetical protein